MMLSQPKVAPDNNTKSGLMRMNTSTLPSNVFRLTSSAVLQALKSLTIAVLVSLAAQSAFAQQGDGTDVPIRAHVEKPRKVPPTAERIAALRIPTGFKVSVFAEGLKGPRIIAVGDSGIVYVSRREQGDVLMLKDADGDGRADGPAIPVMGRPGAHGLAVHDGKLYVATVKQVFVAPIQAGGLLGPATMIIHDLPDAGQHPDRTLAFGPDGMLYISVGSTCNACNEDNPENATILRASPDGKSRTIFATGLRNTIGFDWELKTGELWGFDEGIDFLGDDIQPEELDHIRLGKRYGWPHIWGAGGVNPQSTPVGEITKEDWKAGSEPMVLGYTAHAAPMQLLFYNGEQFPSEYRGDAFATMRGSWNRESPSGYEIVRIHFERGQAQRIEPFVSGFVDTATKTHFARPVGLAVAQDGALLMADDGNGSIYRISYGPARKAGNGAMSNSAAHHTVAPADSMLTQADQGNNVPLALERWGAQTPGMQLSAADFQNASAMPLKLSSYGESVSPALRWNAVRGAGSYAIILEDPDSKDGKPFVHWVIWNIPANTLALREGLPTAPRLTDPEGVLQGRTRRGVPGYYGPRPPIGDPPHHYHFQIFALDRMLDVPFGSTRDEVMTTAQGHVLAAGELVGLFSQQQNPPP